MKFQIDETSQIKEVQCAFSGEYPFLKLDFFNNALEETKLAFKNNFNSSTSINQPDKSAVINMNKYTTVTELEQEIYETFGTLLRVFRRSGNNWLLTSSADDRTLEMQNQQGAITCKRAAVLDEMYY